jgi:hypothetical protein
VRYENKSSTKRIATCLKPCTYACLVHTRSAQATLINLLDFSFGIVLLQPFDQLLCADSMATFEVWAAVEGDESEMSDF